MTREEKNGVIDEIASLLENNSSFYLADISGLSAAKTSLLRRQCFGSNIKLTVAKNTLIKKALERSDKDFGNLFEVLTGGTSILVAEDYKAPAKLIKQFRKSSDKPILKGAFVQDTVFIGDDQLDTLIKIKSKNELIGEVIGLLQSPAKNVISGLKGSGQKIAGLVKTLQERNAA